MTSPTGYNPPQFKIHGQERRELKKKVSLMRRDLGAFDRCHSVHKDMAMVYGGEHMSDSEAEIAKDADREEILAIEAELAEPYEGVIWGIDHD